MFAVGNPGQSDRHDTWAEVSWKHRGRYRFASEAYADMVRIHREYLAERPELRDEEESNEFSLVTAAKYMFGARIAFADVERAEREALAEQRWLRGLAEDERLGSLCLPAFEDLDRTLTGGDEAFLRYAYQSPWYFEGRWFGPLRRAMWVLEALDPERSEAERRGARRRALESWPAVTELEQRYFTAHLARARATLGAKDPAVRAMLAGRTPSDAVRHVVESSRIARDDFVHALLERGPESLAACEDPAIVAARVLYPLHLVNDAVVEQAERCMRVNARRVGLAIATLGGVEVCPEPSFSLRLGDGFVRGYEQTGTWIPASNTLMGMFARAQEFPGHVDFELPELWRERMASVDLSTPFNFVCTIDTTGGSSGSAILDRGGELVGVLFDGNAQSVENGFTYRERQARSIAVHAAGMLEVLDQVYGAQRLLLELRAE